jgi:YD repeat-containing protein
MKKITLSVLSVAALLVGSCGPKDEIQPEKTPLLVRVNDKTYGWYGPGDEVLIQSVTDFTYDAQGNRIGRTTQSTHTRLNDNSRTENTATNGYEYDADGYLLKETSGGVVTATHEYANGRLAKTTKGVNGSRVITYAYNTAGLLTLVTTNDGRAITSTAYEYTDGRLSKKTNMLSDGKSSIVSYVTNAQGLVEREIFDGSLENRYQYDAEGQKIRMELWRGGKPSGDFRTYQYDNQKLLPWGFKYKGHPASEEAFFGKSVHNLLKQVFWTTDADGAPKESYSEAYEYQYNSQGYPTVRKIGKNETTYVYQDVN